MAKVRAGWVAFLGACGGDVEETGIFGGADPIPFEIVDQGLSGQPGEGACDGLGVEMLRDPEALAALYADVLVVDPVPEVDFEADRAILAWVEGCAGEPTLQLDSLTAGAPDHLVASYVLEAGLDTSDALVTAYLLVRLDAEYWSSIESTLRFPKAR